MQEALRRYGPPKIFNTDQGGQYTSEAFTAVLQAQGVTINMDGKGRWVDKVFVERLLRSGKYETVYVRAYESPAVLRAGLTCYFEFYNRERRHQAFNHQTPDAVYFENPQVEQAASGEAEISLIALSTNWGPLLFTIM